MKKCKVNRKKIIGAFLFGCSVVSPVMATTSGTDDSIIELLFKQYPEFELQIQNYEGSAIVEYTDKLSESSDLPLLKQALRSLRTYEKLQIEQAYTSHQLTVNQKSELESFSDVREKDPSELRKIEKTFIQMTGSKNPEVVEKQETLLALKWAEIRLQDRVGELTLEQ